MPTRKNTKKLASNPKTPLIISREWDFNTFRATFYFPCFIQKTESTLLRLRLTWLVLPSQEAGAYPRNWEITPCHAPFPRWNRRVRLESSACTVGPFASQQTSTDSADLRLQSWIKGARNQNPSSWLGVRHWPTSVCGEQEGLVSQRCASQVAVGSSMWVALCDEER